MSFTVTKMIVSGGDKVVALDWAYTNEVGSVCNYYNLPEPYGDVPLSDCTQELMLEWLTAGEGMDASTYDAYISRRKQMEEEQAAISEYKPQPKAAPTKVVEESFEEPDLAPLGG